MLRGQTTFKARATQGRDFSGIRFGNITPTDLDGLIEYHNKAYVLIEAKLERVELAGGQKLALERLCDDLQKIKPTILVLVSHNTPPEYEIIFSDCTVEKYRYKGAWRVTKNPVKLKQLIDSFFEGLQK